MVHMPLLSPPPSCLPVASALPPPTTNCGTATSMPRFPVARALRRAATFHLGSVALGSFILALVQFGRLMLEYLDKKTRRAQQESKVWMGARREVIRGRGQDRGTGCE